MASASAVGFRESAFGWIRSPGWDLFWMFSAVWGSALLVTTQQFVPIAAIAFAVAFVNRFVALGHSWSTTYMVLGSPLLAEERRSNSLKYVWIPVAIVLFSFGLGFQVSHLAQFPLRGELPPSVWPWALYVAVFWVGHFWHFGNQDFGVLSLYRVKSQQHGQLDRRVDKFFCVWMMFFVQPVIFLAVVSGSPFSEAAFDFLPLSRGVISSLADFCVFSVPIATLVVIGFELRKSNTSRQKLVYYAVMFTHPVVLYFVDNELGLYYMAGYLWSHWMIAIGLVSRINSNHYESEGDSPRTASWRHAGLLGLIAVGVGVLTGPYTNFAILSTKTYRSTLSTIGPETVMIAGFFLGWFLCEQLLHYYCDRCLFRFRDKGVRAAVAPLL